MKTSRLRSLGLRIIKRTGRDRKRERLREDSSELLRRQLRLEHQRLSRRNPFSERPQLPSRARVCSEEPRPTPSERRRHRHLEQRQEAPLERRSERPRPTPASEGLAKPIPARLVDLARPNQPLDRPRRVFLDKRSPNRRPPTPSANRSPRLEGSARRTKRNPLGDCFPVEPQPPHPDKARLEDSARKQLKPASDLVRTRRPTPPREVASSEPNRPTRSLRWEAASAKTQLQQLPPLEASERPQAPPEDRSSEEPSTNRQRQRLASTRPPQREAPLVEDSTLAPVPAHCSATPPTNPAESERPACLETLPR
uniref:(northern house mosquito) hypothetical protein n=1 Tax=Culex pipiens TaxID=7175 RepID=A0A8D8MV65_CULPI